MLVRGRVQVFEVSELRGSSEERERERRERRRDAKEGRNLPSSSSLVARSLALSTFGVCRPVLPALFGHFCLHQGTERLLGSLFIEERDRKEPRQGAKKEVKGPEENSPIESEKRRSTTSLFSTSTSTKTELLPTTTCSGATSAAASQAPVAASQKGNPRGRPCMRECWGGEKGFVFSLSSSLFFLSLLLAPSKSKKTKKKKLLSETPNLLLRFNHVFLYKVLLAPPPADGPALTRVGRDAFFFALPRRLAA